MNTINHFESHTLARSDLELIGTVTSGLGDGTFFTQLDWVVDFFKTHLGFLPYRGTFNLQMRGEEWLQGRDLLLQGAGIDVPPKKGRCGANCYPVRLTGCVNGVALFPAVDDYPLDKLEVIAPINVRQALGVNNGDRLKVFIDIASDTRLQL